MLIQLIKYLLIQFLLVIRAFDLGHCALGIMLLALPAGSDGSCRILGARPEPVFGLNR